MKMETAKASQAIKFIETIRDILLTAEKANISYSVEDEDSWIKDLLQHLRLEVRASNKFDGIYFLSDSTEDFDLSCLNQKIPSGYYVYYYVVSFNDQVFKYFTNKIEAFKYFRSLQDDILICSRLLIDTERGVIVDGKTIEQSVSLHQHFLYSKWIEQKYPIGTHIEILKAYNKKLNGKQVIVVGYDYKSIKIDSDNQLVPGRDQFRIIN